MQQELPLKEGTAGLRVITVILAVMLLHVLFIGGVALYHLLRGEGKLAAGGSAAAKAPAAVAADASRARPGGRPEEGSPKAASAAPASALAREAAKGQTDAPALSIARDSERKKGGGKRLRRASFQGNGEADTSAAASANGLRAEAAAPRVYRVVRGDSLWRIARRFHVGLDDLMKANQLTPASKLQIGQELRIPAEKANRGRRSGGLAGG
ncbi:LysM domain-containing protein [Methylacidimicrobium sp. AP8]|uniref:LysM peptidoglycan-binding domain-containing protein n=1 Tax=Methylacidimicrobium sp. AP8 TaxID=2730359 RepID=UPI001924A107|nr:LysM domain-containing protein [Methylacidimicrobium sp. AP8]